MHDFDPRSLKWQSGFEWLNAFMINTFLFWLAAMLIVPLGPAITALFAGLSGSIRPVPTETFRRFWQALKSTFGRSWLLLLLDAVLGAILFIDIRLFLSFGTVPMMIIAYGFGLIAIFLGMVNVYAWTILAWYPRPFGRLLKHAVLLAVGHPIQAIGGLVAPATAVWLFLMLPRGLNVLVLMFGPAVGAFLMGKAAWLALQRYPLPDEELHFGSERSAQPR